MLKLKGRRKLSMVLRRVSAGAGAGAGAGAAWACFKPVRRDSMMRVARTTAPSPSSSDRMRCCSCVAHASRAGEAGFATTGDLEVGGDDRLVLRRSAWAGAGSGSLVRVRGAVAGDAGTAGERTASLRRAWRAWEWISGNDELGLEQAAPNAPTMQGGCGRRRHAVVGFGLM